MQPALNPEAPFRFWRYFLLGILFDLGLVVLVIFLPESSTQTELHNFVVVTNFPLIAGMAGDNDPLAVFFALLLGIAIIGSFWGFVLYGLAYFAKKLSNRLLPQQRRTFKCGVAILCLLMLLLLAISSRSATPVPFVTTPEVTSTVNGNTAFALDLYQKLKGQPGNLFFSPYSISASLAMTYAGARGQTQAEMARVLHFDSGQTNVPLAFGELTTRMHQIQRWNKITLLTANSLWCQRDYQFTNTYLDLIHKYYDAEAQPVDFDLPDLAAGEINGWIERQTNGKFHNAVDPGQLDRNTKLVLCDAIYFKGKWQQQFKVSDTRPRDFYINTNRTVTVPMMVQTGNFKMIRTDDRSIGLLELPYTGTDLSMVILLPAPDFFVPILDVDMPDLDYLERNLTATNLQSWLAKLDKASPEKTSVALPKFTTTQSFDLTKNLQSLGMISAFDSSADFSGMDGTTYLYISDVIHKAFVDVNESGTEAAAISIEIAKTKGMIPGFIVNRPFIFLIRDNGSGSILFIGRIVDPTK
jgi:serine protease inhibitor